MSKPFQSKPFSQAKINNILANNPSNQQSKTVQQTVVKHIQPITTDTQQPQVVLQQQIEFDSLHPEENIKTFLSFSRSVISRYEGNIQRRDDLERQIQDIEHVMELSRNKNAAEGYNLYKKLRDARRERRACKSEIDLLKPLYDYLCNNNTMNELSQIQGNCRTSKEIISKRQYTLRTNIL